MDCKAWSRLTSTSLRTTRAYEAIYAGCIPVFLADRNYPPFADILDYSAFSITIAENSIHKIEDILSGYSADDIAHLQVAGLKVRDAFLYQEGFETERKGPLFYSQLSMALRLPLLWPTSSFEKC